MDTTTVNCIFYGQQGNLETCTVLCYCKEPDRCPFKIEAETELKHKITEEDWRDSND